MLTLVASGTTDAAAQARAVSATTLHKAPGGALLARLPGTVELRVGRARSGWSEVTLDGWVATSSLTADRRDGFDLRVTPKQGAALREKPRGDVLGRLQPGMLVSRVAREGAWTRVRRTGWVATKAIAAAGTAARKPPARAAAPATDPAYRAMQGTRATGSARPAAPPPAQAPAQTADGTERIEVARGTGLLVAPEGAPLAALQPGATGRVLGRSGEWVRVQMEGWVREPDLKAAAGNALVGVTAAEVRANPERYVGQVVEWRMQYVAAQVADDLRPEMPAGQPYILARGPLPEPGFLYVMVSRDQVARFQALPPLSEVTIRATVRAARSRFLATPVVELQSVVDAPPGTR